MRTFPLKKLTRIVDWVWESPHSDFYRKFWGDLGIRGKPMILSEKNWDRIPFLSRESLSSVPHPSERLFVPLKKIEALRSTSGTSGQGPLFFWRGAFHEESYERCREAGSKIGMTFYAYQNFMGIALPAAKYGMSVLCGDAHNLPRSARLASLAEIDTLFVTPTLALIFSEYLKKEKHAEKIKCVLLWGEFCSSETFKMLKGRFPRARFIFEYGFSETPGVVAYSSDKCPAANFIMHFNSSAFFPEIIGGELAVTTLSLPHAMPLVRYRTGDAAEFVSGVCICGDRGLRVRLQGRINGDFVRAGGGELRLEELDRVMSHFFSEIDPLFRMEVREERGRIFGCTIFAYLKSGCRIKPEILSQQITSALCRELRLSPTMKLQDAISAGLFLRPEVVFREAADPDIKNPRLFRVDD